MLSLAGSFWFLPEPTPEYSRTKAQFSKKIIHALFVHSYIFYISISCFHASIIVLCDDTIWQHGTRRLHIYERTLTLCLSVSVCSS
jgi:hypothetical protein